MAPLHPLLGSRGPREIRDPFRSGTRKCEDPRVGSGGETQEQIRDRTGVIQVLCRQTRNRVSLGPVPYEDVRTASGSLAPWLQELAVAIPASTAVLASVPTSRSAG